MKFLQCGRFCIEKAPQSGLNHMTDLTDQCRDAGQGACRGPIKYRMPVTATGPSLPRCDGHWASRLVEKAAAGRRSRRVAREQRLVGGIMTVEFCDMDGHGHAYAIGSACDRDQLIEMAAEMRDKYVAEHPRVPMNPEPVIY